jgi:hypothetical protein
VAHLGQIRELHPGVRQEVGQRPEIVRMWARAVTWQVLVTVLQLTIDLIVLDESTEAVDLTAPDEPAGLKGRDGVTVCVAVTESHVRTDPAGRMELVDLIAPVGPMAAVAGVTGSGATTGTSVTGATIIGITIIGMVTGIMDIGTADTVDIGMVGTIGIMRTGILGPRGAPGRSPDGFGARTTTIRATEATITPIMSNRW